MIINMWKIPEVDPTHKLSKYNLISNPVGTLASISSIPVTLMIPTGYRDSSGLLPWKRQPESKT